MTVTFQITNGDVTIGSSGQPNTIADNVKLRQDVQENLAIEIQANGFGAGLESLIGVLTDEYAMRSEINQRVRKSIVAMQNLQDRYHRAQRPLNERIARVEQIIVTSVGDKKTTFLFKVDVRTVANTTETSTGGLV